MDVAQWHRFFATSVEVLGAGEWHAERSPSWCAWTTFTRLREDSGYWTCGLPAAADVLETQIVDGGVWGQPFLFSDLAHVLVPREFTWETTSGPNWIRRSRHQDLATLARRLGEAGVPHRLTELALEVKCY